MAKKKQNKILSAFEIFYDDDLETHMIIVARNKIKENPIMKISCKNGIPVSGYTYDNQSDTYHICGSDYLHLGKVPMALKLFNLKSRWQTRIPIPDEFVVDYFSEMQKAEMINFKKKFPESDYEHFFVQMINCN